MSTFGNINSMVLKKHKEKKWNNIEAEKQEDEPRMF
jgi:hypothetical protein